MNRIFFVASLFFPLVLLFMVDAEIRSDRTKQYVRPKNRISTTGAPEDLSTITTESTAGPLVDRKIIELKANRDRKIQELLSPRNKCGVLKLNTTVPWVVVIEHRDPTGRDKRKTISKGVLIDSQHVLTTVSSVHNSHPFWVVASVRLGDTTTWITGPNSSSKHLNYTRVEVSQVFQHSSKDIAIIKLASQVEFTDYIQPICLPIDENYNFREMYFHMCKRSQDKERKFDVELMSSMPLGPQDCETLFHRKGAAFEATEFCSWDEFGDNCLGDVGGPLMAHFNGRYIVIGLNSYVFTHEDFDADGYPGVYVKVGAFLRWIKSISEL